MHWRMNGIRDPATVSAGTDYARPRARALEHCRDVLRHSDASIAAWNCRSRRAVIHSRLRRRQKSWCLTLIRIPRLSGNTAVVINIVGIDQVKRTRDG